MADIRYQKLFLDESDGSAYSTSNVATADVRLRTSDSDGSDNGEYTGNVASSGDFTEVGNGFWYIGIDENDSGLYRIEIYDNTTSSWTAVNGAAPVKIDLEDYVKTKSESVMLANIDMANYDIDEVENVNFANDTSTITSPSKSFEIQKLLDKTASETITGDYDFTGALKKGGTTITATAAEINRLSGVNTVFDIETGLNPETRSAKTSGSNLSESDGGFVPVNMGTTSQFITLPAIAESNAGIMYLISATGGSDFKIDTTGSDVIVEQDGTTTNSDVTLSSGESMVVMSDGIKNWLILGGLGY
jgi:uncharacterized protein YaaQ